MVKRMSKVKKKRNFTTVAIDLETDKNIKILKIKFQEESGEKIPSSKIIRYAFKKAGLWVINSAKKIGK